MTTMQLINYIAVNSYRIETVCLFDADDDYSPMMAIQAVSTGAYNTAKWKINESLETNTLICYQVD